MPAPASYESSHIAVWTEKSYNDDVWFFVTGWFSTEGWDGTRSTIDLRALSGNISVRVGYQTSNDQVNLDTPVAIGTARTAEGRFIETSYADLSSAITGKLYVRFGILVRNYGTETSLELARCGIRLDFK